LKVVVIAGWAPSLWNFRRPLLECLVARGHQVRALAPDGDPELSRRLRSIGVTLEEVSLARAGLDPFADLRSIAVLAGRLRALAPDLVFSYTIKPVIYGSLAAALVGVPRRTALVTGLGYLFTNPPTNARQRVVRRAATLLYRLGLSRCQPVFLQNPDDHRELVELGALSPHQHVQIVRGSGVDLDEFPTIPLPAGPLQFLFMGRLLRDKGIYEYVEAARIVRRTRHDVVFSVVGWIDDNPTSVTEGQIRAWQAEGLIQYIGSATDVRPHLAAAHVLVLPSYREGTPRSVLEAMSTGRAVITTDVPGCRETIVDEESGLLIPARDAPALAAAANRLADDRELLTRLAHNGRTRAEDLYDAHKIAARMLDVLGL
jgi:glycosyltransferase involved in cell wall biosynthesis